MRLFTLASLLVLVVPAIATADERRVMRLDYYHTGSTSDEIFAVDQVMLEPLPWPGNPHRPLDDLNLGNFFFEVSDKATKKVLYSRGFDSLFGEWVTTAEARTAHRTFHESLRFPAPEAPVQVVVKRRDAKNGWREVWSV